MTHPYVDPEGDQDRADDTASIELPWVAMDMGGSNLRRQVEAAGPITGQAFKDAAFDMCDAVAHIHEQNMIHRDIKPENFVADASRPGRLLMIDFGIAKYVGEDVDGRPFDDFTKQKEFVGPQAFSSAELLEYARDKSVVVDRRSDLFQLGKVLWFMATGIVSAGIPSRKLDPFNGPLYELVSSLLCDDPNDRLQSAANVRSALLGL